MKHKNRPPRRGSKPGSSNRWPARQGADESVADEVDPPDRPPPDGPLLAGPADPRQATQADIERVDEGKLGSVETVPQAEPAGGIASFVEPAAGAATEGQLPDAR